MPSDHSPRNIENMTAAMTRIQLKKMLLIFDFDFFIAYTKFDVRPAGGQVLTRPWRIGRSMLGVQSFSWLFIDLYRNIQAVVVIG